MGIYWTIQTEGAWMMALRKGCLTGDGRRIPPEFRPAYHWMMAQMKKRLKNYRGGFPIWLWTHKPDLRTCGHLPRGTAGYRIKVQLPDDQVVLSDFLGWHEILNFYCNNDSTKDRTCSTIKEHEKIFNFYKNQYSNDYDKKRQQAVAEIVRMNEVLETTYFIAR